MSQLEQLFNHRLRLESSLREIFERGPDSLFDYALPPGQRQAWDMLAAYCTRPGKGIRGCLVLEGYESITHTQADGLCMQTAIAVELVHAYLLIVDDVMDLSPLRRGEKTIHEQYLSDGNDRTIHESHMLAITGGLIVQHITNILIAQAEGAADTKMAVLQIMHQNIALTGFGQWDDLQQQVGRKFGMQDVLNKYALKSSLYTFVNPLELACVLGRGELTPNWREEIRAFGMPAGMAFQLHDDELGIFGDSDKTGKANYDDIQEGKFTVLLAHAMNVADDSQKKDLLRIMGNMHSGAQELDIVRAIFRDTGSLAYARDRKIETSNDAQQALSHMTCFPDEFKRTLQDLMRYSIQRDS